jgi:predicted transcriptional regulator
MRRSTFKPDPYVVARFYDRLRRSKEGRLKRTRLQTATGLNWSVFTRYLDRLLELGLLEVEQEGKETFIRPTPKGREFYQSLLTRLEQLLGTGLY